MSVEIKVPVLPESVSDATVATWHKKPGDSVAQDENLVDIETDKVVLEVVSPCDGVLGDIIKGDGETVLSEELIGSITEGSSAAPKDEALAKIEAVAEPSKPTKGDDAKAGPAVRRMLDANDIKSSDVSASGSKGQITRTDVENHLNGSTTSSSSKPSGARTVERVPMSRLRSRIAERLVSAQQTAAILTTFNEVNMQPVMSLRTKYKDMFEKKHGVKLGFMSFFTKAVTEALKEFPAVNASIDGNEIVYHGYCDIGIAVSSPRGLVVPVIRNADRMTMAEVEGQIVEYGQKAKNGQITVEDMTGGTFTISNGGVFGSLMSTPILNPPQSGILGMHKIEQRAVVENGEIVIRPMMYLALSYDHRIIDGSESVRFLVKVKELLEDPARLVLAV